MTGFFESARMLAEGDLPLILFDAAIKGAVILMLATGLAFALRRASASLRHLVWSLSVAALVVLPLLTVLAPHWAVPGLPTLAPPASNPTADTNPSAGSGEWLTPKASPFVAPPQEKSKRNTGAQVTPDVSFVLRSAEGFGGVESASSGTATAGAVVDEASPEGTSPIGAPRRSTRSPAESTESTGGPALPWTAWGVLLWAAVSLVILTGIGLGLMRTWLMGRMARRLSSGALARLTEELSARIGLRRRVSLLQCRGRCMPLTWGVFRPTILLPADAVHWPTARLRAVLLHELAHVKRYDYLTQLLARFACALHWFNPLVWQAAKKLQEERELACDDQVLRVDSLPSEYAGHLLELARSLKAEPLTSLATVAMARPSQLGDRLRAVLDENRARAMLSGRAKVSAWLCAALIVVPIAGASPGVSEPRAIQPEELFSLPVAASQVGDDPTTYKRLAPEYELEPRKDLSAERSRGAPAKPRLVRAAGGISEPGPAAEPSTSTLRLNSPSALQLPGCDWFTSGSSSSTSVSIDDDRMKVNMRRGDCDLSVDLDGEIRFNASFTEIASLSGGGELEIEEKRGRETRRLLLSEDDGQLSRRWYVNRDERPYDSDARAWLSGVLLVLFRRAGLQATERAEYILEQDGVDGLLREISQIPSDHTARRYYTVLLSQAQLEPEQVREIVSQAGKEIDSDHELAEMLIAIAENQPLDESVRIAYVEAAGSIGSDYEQRRVLSAILTREGLSSDLARAMLRSAANIDSDHELAELLIELLHLRPLDETMTDAFFEAVGSLDSDFETRRVLEAALQAGAPSRNALDRTLQAAATIGSDHELGQLLIRVADLYPLDAPLPESYVTAAHSIDSSSELGRVLMTLLARGNLSSGTVASTLDVATAIDSDYELGRVLAAVARDYEISGPVRPAFFQAVSTISSDFEHQRVLTTVLREQTLDDPLVRAVLESAVEIDSDHELSGLLLELVDRYSIGDDLRPAFDRAVETIGSKHERDRVLSAAYRSQRSGM